MFTVGNKCPPIFGPKIRNFDKVQIKRKNK